MVVIFDGVFVVIFRIFRRCLVVSWGVYLLIFFKGGNMIVCVGEWGFRMVLLISVCGKK